jgi:hypothetical protein
VDALRRGATPQRILCNSVIAFAPFSVHTMGARRNLASITNNRAVAARNKLEVFLRKDCAYDLAEDAVVVIHGLLLV